jgi:hypothetical protein
LRVFKLEPIGLIVILLFIALFSGVVISSVGEEGTTIQFYLMTIAFFLFLVGLLINYLRTRIILDEYSISYVTLFRKKTMTYGEIIRIDTYAKGQPSAQGMHGTYETILHSHQDKITIRIKLFSRKNLKELAATLIHKCKQAEIDEQTKMMSDGKMPSIFFKYQ